MPEKKVVCSLCGISYPESNLEYVERDGDKPRPYCTGKETENCLAINSYEKDAEEIAMSFINGNIGWVRKHIDNNARLFRAVQQVIEETAPGSLESFNRVIGGC